MIIERIVRSEYNEDGTIWMPPDEFQDLVRCKDCKHLDELHGYKPRKLQCPRNKRFVTEDWFCADGKRREKHETD